MLAFGWTIERSREGDAFGLHACMRRISQSGQVSVLEYAADKFVPPKISLLFMLRQKRNVGTEELC